MEISDLQGMYKLAAAVWAQPAGARLEPPVSLRGVSCRPLRIPPEVTGTPFAVSFETVCQRLDALPRMLIEPDGSLVWTCSSPAWQLDGNLYDRADRLLYVDLSGTVPAADFDRFLAALDWPGTPVMFELRDAGIFVNETSFREWAAC